MARCMTVVRVLSEAAPLAGRSTPHPGKYEDGSSLCAWCYGYRDDPRHWLPSSAQRVADLNNETRCEWLCAAQTLRLHITGTATTT